MLAEAYIVTKNNDKDNLLSIKDFIRRKAGDSIRLQKSDNLNLHEHRNNHSEESIMFDDAIQYYKNNDYDLAVDRLMKILDMNSKNVRASWMLCYMTAIREDFEGAIIWGNRCIEIDPLFKEAYYILSLIHLQKNEYNDALEKLKKAIYIDPNFALAYFTIGNIYTLIYLHSQPIDCFEKANDLLSSDPFSKGVFQIEYFTVKELFSLIDLKFRTL